MRPLRRSITFWSGLFVLVSLLWLLIDSHRMYSGISIQDGSSGRYIGAGIGEGFLGFVTRIERGFPSSIRFHREPCNTSVSRNPLRYLIPYFIADRSSLRIPFPLLILLHLGLWRFLMHRRRLRLQRAELAAPTLAVHPSTNP